VAGENVAITTSIPPTLQLVSFWRSANAWNPSKADPRSPAKKDRQARNGRIDRKRKAKSNGQTTEHYFHLHGNNTTHNTNGCYTLKNQVEGMKNKPSPF
jgi:hypothetical protein